MPNEDWRTKLGKFKTDNGLESEENEITEANVAHKGNNANKGQAANNNHRNRTGSNNNSTYKGNNANKGQAANNNHGNRTESNNNKTEPYNFVPFSNFILESPLSKMVQDKESITGKQVAFAEYLSGNETYSGHFTIDISNVTPMLINMNNRFFATGNGLCIPGSSVRGLVKNIFKIVASCGWRQEGNGGDFEDRKLYFRSLYAKKSDYQKLVTHYKDKMLTQDKKAIKTKPGFLVRDAEKNYYVIPAEMVKLPREKKTDWTALTGTKTSKGMNMLIYVGVDPNYEDSDKGDNKVHAAPPGIKWHDDYVDVFSGGIDGKKRIYRINEPDINNPLKIDADFIANYKADSARNGLTIICTDDKKEKDLFEKGFVIKNGKIKYVAKAYAHYGKWDYVVHAGDLKDKNQPIQKKSDVSRKAVEGRLAEKIKRALSYFEKDKVCPEGIPGFIEELAQKYEYVVPCFYVYDGNMVTSLGAGPYYRINYSLSISDHLPNHMKGAAKDKIDFADAIFGYKEAWASRVFFEDLYVKESSKEPEMLASDHIKILEKPRPTSFQNYLTSRGGEACHWDEAGARLRGYKMYWHHKADWIDESAARGDKVSLLKENAVFTGKVRFENLTRAELGALSKVFSLGNENDVCFKLGMGKPLGLGSIRFTSKLFVRQQGYYETLFSGNGFTVPKKTDPEKFIADFDELLKVNESFWKSYNDSYDSLKDILSYPTEHRDEKSQWHGKFMYTDKSKSPARVPLLSIKDVVKSKK